jgi:ketosteroid isomerase-like protein
MNKRNVILATALMAVAAVSSTWAQVQESDDVREINKAYYDWVASVEARDIDLWATFLAPNAIFLPPDSPALETTVAIRDYYQALFDDPHFSLECTQVTVEVAASRDIAWARGTCDATFTTPDGTVGGGASKWTKVWVRLENGAWKCKLNTWNTNGPD